MIIYGPKGRFSSEELSVIIKVHHKIAIQRYICIKDNPKITPLSNPKSEIPEIGFHNNRN